MLPGHTGHIPDLGVRGPEYYQDILVTFRTSNIDLVDPRRPRPGILPGETGNIPDLMIGNIPDLVNGGVSDLIPILRGVSSLLTSPGALAVSYTHLTLPTKA